MDAFASRTGTDRNLAALRGSRWGLLLSATGVHRTEGFAKDEGGAGIVLDNGAWTAYKQGRPLDEAAFVRLVEGFGHRAEWVVAPDIVGGGMDSLKYSLKWLPWCLERCPKVLIGVQDGMARADLAPLVGPRVGIAVGGTTTKKPDRWGLKGWKEHALHRRTFSDLGCHLHVLRVNSARRIRLCRWAGADSFDGTSATMFAKSLPPLERERAARPPQPNLWERT